MSDSVCSDDWSFVALTADYEKIMNALFKNTKEYKTMAMAFQIYKTLWLKDRTRFRVISDLHQNGPTDPLHFSVTVDICEGWKNTLHFNGYYKGRFIVSNITAQTKDSGLPYGKQYITEEILTL
jgi:hypothetical protein